MNETDIKMSQLPKFSAALLHPRYWPLWSGIGLLWLVVQLPYPLIYRLGKTLGRLAMYFMKRRAQIAYRNLALCFPDKSAQQRHQLVVDNFESVGMGLMETGMAWFWSDRRIMRWSETIGIEHVKAIQAQQRGIVVIGIHFLTLELGARIFGVSTPGIGVYRPNDNPLIDWLQTWGRLRSNKDMLDRKDLKGMVRALKKENCCGMPRIMTMAPPPVYLCPFSLSIRPQPLQVAGCWPECRTPALCLSYHAESPMAKGMNSSFCPRSVSHRWRMPKPPRPG